MSKHNDQLASFMHILNEAYNGVGGTYDCRFGHRVAEDVTHPHLLGRFLTIYEGKDREIQSAIIPHFMGPGKPINNILKDDEIIPNCTIEISRSECGFDHVVTEVYLRTTRDIKKGEYLILHKDAENDYHVQLYIKKKAREAEEFSDFLKGYKLGKRTKAEDQVINESIALITSMNKNTDWSDLTTALIELKSKDMDEKYIIADHIFRLFMENGGPLRKTKEWAPYLSQGNRVIYDKYFYDDGSWKEKYFPHHLLKCPNCTAMMEEVCYCEYHPLNESAGNPQWDERFFPSYTPREMLAMGIFGGDHSDELIQLYPDHWIPTIVKSDTNEGKIHLNHFRSSSDLSKEWFDWYCRYFLGYRDPIADTKNIDCWKDMVSKYSSRLINNLEKALGTRNPHLDKSLDYLRTEGDNPRYLQTLLELGWDWKQDYLDFDQRKINLEKIIDQSVSDTFLVNIQVHPINEAIDHIDWSDNFFPCFTPQEMLEQGIFGGLYINSDMDEFPAFWFDNVILSVEGKPNPELNKFGKLSGMKLKDWQDKGWISEHDPKGWFQWYCRYFMGRRIPDEDKRQIKRWKGVITRHRRQLMSAVKSKFNTENLLKPEVQEYLNNNQATRMQALLQWGWDYQLDIMDPKVKKANLDKVTNASKADQVSSGVLNEAATMSNKTLRQNIENDLYKFLNAMDVTGANTKMYREYFATLADRDFFIIMDRIFDDPDYNLVIQYKPLENVTNYSHFEQVANKFNILIYDYLVLPFVSGADNEDTPVTVEKMHLGVLKVRRLHQEIISKTGVSTSIAKRNVESGQVIGEDKNARVSDVDLYSLKYLNQTAAAVEFMNERADDMHRKQQMLNSIRSTGEYSLADADNDVLHKVSTMTIFYYMIASGIKTNLIEDSGLILPSTIKSKDLDN